jgi:CHAD domain-containing protein
MRRSRTRAKTNASAAVGVVLSNVSRQLLDVAHGELSEKALHELRIACRRAEAALRLCQDAADGRAWRWLKRRLKLLRRTCNAARDDDVLEQWIQQHKTSSSKSLRQAIRAHRAQLQPQIVELAQRLSDQHRFERRSKKVIKQLRACELRGQIARAFGRRLFDELSRFVKALPAQHDDASALHRLRIVGKRLRYASELVAEIWPDITFTELIEHLHLLQDRLGIINDQLVGARRLRKRTPDRAARSLTQKAQETAIRLQRKFWRWWQALPIERMLADTTAEVLTLMSKTA